MSKTIWGLPFSYEQQALQIETSRLQVEKVVSQFGSFSEGQYPKFVTIQGENAIVAIDDMILSHEIMFFGKKFGVGGQEWSEAIERLRSDPAIKNVILDIESPGGETYAGMAIATAVEKLNAEKPVYSYVRGCCCSAAYWIASKTRSISAGSLSTVGSIGCYVLMYDDTEALMKHGVKPVMIRSAPLKGIGADTITDEQQAHVQEMVDSIADKFYLDVAESRSLSLDNVGDWGSGGFWTAEEAQKKGLVDNVVDWPAFYEQITRTSSENVVSIPLSQTEDYMSANTKAQSASVHELKARFPKADADFIVAQMMDGATLEEATTAYIRHLESANTKLETQLAVAKAKAEEEEEEKKESKKSKAKKSKSEDDEDQETDAEDGDDDDPEAKAEEEEEEKKESKKSKAKKSKSEDDEEGDKETGSKKSKASGSAGTYPISGKVGSGRFQSAREEWNTTIKDVKASNPTLSHDQAVSLVVSTYPDLHHRLIDEANR